MLTVLLDGRPLWDASRYRGIGTYVRSLLGHLAVHSEVSVSATATRRVDLPFGVTRVPVSRLHHGRYSDLEHRLRRLFELRKTQTDVFHSAALDPPSHRVPMPWVQTVYDVTPAAYDDPVFARERKVWLSKRGPAITRADAVITCSRYTADEATRLLGLNPNNVTVAMPGVDPDLRAPTPRPTSDEPFLLYVGEFGPHKGYAEAFEVASRVADAGWPHHLKVAGRIAPWVEPIVRGILAQRGKPDRVHLLGYVTKQELRYLYGAASALVFTSRYEGFGLPALEAMAMGTPVIGFRNSSVPEVVGDAGVLVKDGDVGAFVDELLGVLSDETRWHQLSEAGIARASTFDWAHTADLHVKVYQDVAGVHR